MLTGSLLHFTRRGERVYPRLVRPENQQVRETAQALLGLFAAHRGRARGELEQTLREAAPPNPGGGLYRGMAKLLLERSTFTVPGNLDPPALRARLFEQSAQAWRVREAPHREGWRERIVDKLAREMGLAPARIEEGLYADLAENHRLITTRVFTPETLAFRYNVAQVQGLLLRAERLVLRAPAPPLRRLRQVFRYLQFFGLLFQVVAQGPEGLEVVVDGPLSLLEQGARYGLNLAQFFPVLLLWEGAWELEAGLVPRVGGRAATLLLGPHPLLRSHFPDQGQWVPPDLERVQQAFSQSGGEWRAAPAETILPLPGNRCLVPDLEFTRTHPPARVFLEYLPYPVAERARARLEMIAARGQGDYLLACRATPALREVAQNHPALFLFRRTLLPTALRERLATL